MNKTYDSYASILSVRSLSMGDTVIFKNSNLSFKVGANGDHFISSGSTVQSHLTKLLTALGFQGQKSPAVIFCDILGVPTGFISIFSGCGLLPFTFYKLVKHLMMVDESLACNWHYSDKPLALSSQQVSYGDVICLKKKEGGHIRLRVSNHHFINLDYPEQKQGVFEYLGIKTPMAFGRETYGYKPLNESTGNFPHYKKNDWEAATKMAAGLIVAARDKIKNTGEVEIKLPTSKGNPCGEILLREQDEVEVKPLPLPTGTIYYLDFQYGSQTLRSRPRITRSIYSIPKITKASYWGIGSNDLSSSKTLSRPRVSATEQYYNIKVSKNRFVTKIS